jgi:hypothetical protein
MTRLLGLRIALGVIGGLFVLVGYEMVVLVRQEPATSMMLSLYVTMGVFLLLAIRKPWEHRSLIAYAAWANLAHGLWMGMQCLRGMVMKSELIGSAVFVVIWAVLVALRPRSDARIDA